MSQPDIETPKPLSESTTDNWVARVGGLPHPVQHVAQALIAAGHGEQQAIRIAVGKMHEWAHGADNVHPDTKAVYAGAEKEWEAKRAAARGSMKKALMDVDEPFRLSREGFGSLHGWEEDLHPRGFHGKWVDKGVSERMADAEEQHKVDYAHGLLSSGAHGLKQEDLDRLLSPKWLNDQKNRGLSDSHRGFRHMFRPKPGTQGQPVAKDWDDAEHPRGWHGRWIVKVTPKHAGLIADALSDEGDPFGEPPHPSYDFWQRVSNMDKPEVTASVKDDTLQRAKGALENSLDPIGDEDAQRAEAPDESEALDRLYAARHDTRIRKDADDLVNEIEHGWDPYFHPRGYHGRWITSLNHLRRTVGLRSPAYEPIGQAERELRAAESERERPLRARAHERNAVMRLHQAMGRLPEDAPHRQRVAGIAQDLNDAIGAGGPDLTDRLLARTTARPDEPEFSHLSRAFQRVRPEVRHELLFKTREQYPPVDYIVRGAKAYRKAHGLPEPLTDVHGVRAPLEKAQTVGKAFGLTEDQSKDPHVRAAFEDFKRQNREMWDFMTAPQSEGGLGIKVDFTSKKDPYPSATAQADDLRDNHHITIESGLGGDHSATMSRQEYDRFRAVHDVFGHAGTGGGFDRHGEYQAWLEHMTMYTGEGARAMSSEYHGTNSALWTKAPGDTTTGKSVLLPENLTYNPWDEHGNLVRKYASPSGATARLQSWLTHEDVHRMLSDARKGVEKLVRVERPHSGASPAARPLSAAGAAQHAGQANWNPSAAGWEESKHPRSYHGQFAFVNGGKSYSGSGAAAVAGILSASPQPTPGTSVSVVHAAGHTTQGTVTSHTQVGQTHYVTVLHGGGRTARLKLHASRQSRPLHPSAYVNHQAIESWWRGAGRGRSGGWGTTGAMGKPSVGSRTSSVHKDGMTAVADNGGAGSGVMTEAADLGGPGQAPTTISQGGSRLRDGHKGSRGDRTCPKCGKPAPEGVCPEHGTVKKGAPRHPPNLRPQEKPGEFCGDCEMFWRGQCWGYGNAKVGEHQVCDSWEKDPGVKKSLWVMLKKSAKNYFAFDTAPPPPAPHGEEAKVASEPGRKKPPKGHEAPNEPTGGGTCPDCGGSDGYHSPFCPRAINDPGLRLDGQGTAEGA